MFAAVAGRVTRVILPESHAGTLAERKSETVSHDDSSMEVSGSVRDADARDNASVDVAEPSAKRQKLSTRRISGEELCHLDSEPFDNLEGLEIENLYRDDNVDISDDCDDDMQYDASMMPPSLNSPSVWQPYTGAEPEISHDVLALIDQGADKIEIRRLPEMGVIIQQLTSMMVNSILHCQLRWFAPGRRKR